MTSITALKELDQDLFYSLGELLNERLISYQEAASAIELAGIQAYDSFGRFVVLTPSKATTNYGVSIEGALNVVDGFVRKLCTQIYNNERPEPEELTDDYWRRQELPPVQTYGWIIKDLPDFKTLYEQWSKQESGYNLKDLPKSLFAPQASILKLIRGLVVLNYGDNAAKDLDQERSPLIKQIREELQLKGYSFDDKTLRKYLKSGN